MLWIACCISMLWITCCTVILWITCCTVMLWITSEHISGLVYYHVLLGEYVWTLVILYGILYVCIISSVIYNFYVPMIIFS